MRALTRSRYGQPDVLRVDETDVPEIGPHDILVQVRTTTVNRTDCGILLGKPFPIRFFTGLGKPRALVPGTDFAGDVVSVGSQVTEFVPGDRVFGFNDEGLSSQAELMAVSAGSAISKIPDSISYAQAAASAEGAHYALNFMKRSKFQPGQRVFVYGATGAIGSAAVQLVKAAVSHVTAACSGEHFELVEGLGADVVLDYRNTDLSRYPETFDLFFDAVGKSNYRNARPVLTKSGRYVSSELGPHGQNLYLPLTSRLTPGPRVDFPFPTGSKQSIATMAKMLADQRFDPLIDRSYGLEQARDAYEYVASGQKIGNVLLQIS